MPNIPVLQFVLPFAIFFMMTIMYVAICLFFQRARRKRRERLALQAQAPDQAVYVIPISVSEEDVYRPPRYSTVQFYEPPPAYDELQMKPDVSPPDLPPAYSESISPPAH